MQTEVTRLELTAAKDAALRLIEIAERLPSSTAMQLACDLMKPDQTEAATAAAATIGAALRSAAGALAELEGAATRGVQEALTLANAETGPTVFCGCTYPTAIQAAGWVALPMLNWPLRVATVKEDQGWMDELGRCADSRAEGDAKTKARENIIGAFAAGCAADVGLCRRVQAILNDDCQSYIDGERAAEYQRLRTAIALEWGRACALCDHGDEWLTDLSSQIATKYFIGKTTLLGWIKNGLLPSRPAHGKMTTVHRPTLEKLVSDAGVRKAKRQTK